MFSGKNILNRAMPERLRTLRHCIFTGGVVERNGICSAASYGSAALTAGVLAPPGELSRSD
ncbi:hypothetical protein C7K05_11070 [Faecalibacterium prausnitzii]|uniref:Uncharacterized protein n=1 Tax=Faecalibacterium prausnitzii TaxID=853 RepID=A0A367G4H6_9FIRM|nr:hypothetical protein C7J97_10415 [Faecalibacterium prausnitzii]RCH49213.1 hypothetical protein C7K05_11070 [Faecalibacterium prausnitzii]